MKLIAMETSTRRLSVALWLDGRLFERNEDVPKGGSELLLPWVSQLLDEAGVALAEIDGIAWRRTRGSRIAPGLWSRAGLAFGLIYRYSASSLEALALAAYAGGTERMLASMDARMNEVYYAAYLIHDGRRRRCWRRRWLPRKACEHHKDRRAQDGSVAAADLWSIQTCSRPVWLKCARIPGRLPPPWRVLRPRVWRAAKGSMPDWRPRSMCATRWR